MGCKQMDAVTYPDKEVSAFIEENLVPLRVTFGAMPQTKYFNVNWTPTLLILDREGNEHHRTLGYQSPQELIPMMMLGIAKVDYERGRYKEACVNFNKIISFYPECDSAPEAIYLRGVSLFKDTQEPHHLKEAYELLCESYPKNGWTKRAEPYTLL